ncbi:MAG TPA: DUF1214 domain-containing protein [Nitriliruptoraceae bacterium]|nr:DUF1214 domain-containing protein [Nitriliruptoraceae bacterium]
MNDTRTLRGRLSTVVAVATALALAVALLTPSASAADPAQSRGGPVEERARITEAVHDYVVEFFPLWLVYQQTRLDPSNSLVGPREITPAYRSVVAINDDTLYASTPVDLSSGPVVLTTPAAPTEVTYSVLTLSPFGNVFDSGIRGHRAGDASEEVVYALVPPGYSGSPAVPDGATVIEMLYEFSLLIFRIDKFTGTTDLTSEAETVRRNLRLLPLEDYAPGSDDGATRLLPVETFGIPFKSVADGLIERDPIAWLRQLQEAVGSEIVPPLTARQAGMVAAFDDVFGDGGTAVAPRNRRAFARAAQDAHQAIIDNYLDNRDGGNWIHFTDIGTWDADQSLDRSSIAEYIQWGNSIATSAYYHAFLDVDAKQLKASTRNGYVLTFPADDLPEAERFWSVTAYTPETIELIDNPADKYVVASYDDPEPNADGSISIHIAQDRPRGVPASNWLPVTSDPFNVMLRIYGVVAHSDVATNDYRPPPIERVRHGPGVGRAGSMTASRP